jgi:hypothetical protein
MRWVRGRCRSSGGRLFWRYRPTTQCEHRIGVAEVVEMASRLDASRDLRCLPVAASPAAEVDVPTARVREEQ